MVSLNSFILGTAVALTLAGWGQYILNILRTRKFLPEANFAVSLVVGACLYSYVFFALGHLGIINKPVYWTILVAGFVLSIPGMKMIAKAFRSISVDLSEPDSPLLCRLLFTVILICLLMAMFSAMAPVSDWDSRRYHLGAPKQYIQNGKIEFYSNDITLSFYMAQSMLNLWMMKMGSDSACQILTWWFGLGLLCVTHALGRKLFTPMAGLWATVLVVTFGFFAERSIQPSPDIASTMIGILLIYLLVEFKENITITQIALVGALGGMAVAFRMNMLLFLFAPAIFAVIWWRWFCKLSWSRIFVIALVGSVFCLLFCIPWAIRNYIWTGNPGYPFATTIFGLRTRSSWATEDISFGQWMKCWLIWPFKFFHFGGLTLAFAPLALFFRYRRKISILLLLTLLLGIIAISRFATNAWGTDRYFASIMLIAALLAGAALVKIFQWKGFFHWVLTVLISIIILTDVGAAVVWHYKFIRAATGLTSRDDFLRRTTAYYDDFMWMNDNLPKDAKVLVFAVEEYYLDRDALGFRDKLTPRVGIFDLQRYNDGGEFAEELQKNGVTHLFFGTRTESEKRTFIFLRHWDERELQLFTDLYENHATLVRHNPKGWVGGRLFSGENVDTWLYRLNPEKHYSAN
jgi:hypothetical protein